MNNKTPYLLAAVFSFSFSSATFSNSIIAIVNDRAITLDAISAQIKPDTTKKQKLVLIDQQIDLALKKDKIQEFEIQAQPKSIHTLLTNIASQNGLTLPQLQSNPQYAKILEKINLNLSLKGLQQLIVQQANVALTQAEIDEVLANNPSDLTHLSHQVKIAQIVINSIDLTDSLIQSEDNLIQNFLKGLALKVDNGASFFSLAKLHSQDPSYKNGGKSSWLNEEKLPLAFKQQLDNLELDAISPPFKAGKKGWRIITKIDQRTLDNYLIAVQAKRLQSKKNTYFKNWVKALRKKAYIEIFDQKL